MAASGGVAAVYSSGMSCTDGVYVVCSGDVSGVLAVSSLMVPGVNCWSMSVFGDDGVARVVWSDDL